MPVIKMRKTMTNKLTILFLSLFVTSCVGSMEKLPGSKEKSKYGPTNSEDQYGLISYYEDHGSIARENSYKKMYDACNGSYKIISENIGGSSATVIAPIYGGGAIASNSKKVYIKFICNN
jgi:hypothetical protein